MQPLQFGQDLALSVLGWEKVWRLTPPPLCRGVWTNRCITRLVCIVKSNAIFWIKLTAPVEIVSSQLGMFLTPVGLKRGGLETECAVKFYA